MVARAHRLQREGVEEMLDRSRHRIDVARRAGDRLGQHIAVAVEHPGREVPGLAYRRRKRCAHQGLRLLLDNRDEPAPHDLHVDLGQSSVGSTKHRPISLNSAPAAGYCMSCPLIFAMSPDRPDWSKRTRAAPLITPSLQR